MAPFIRRRVFQYPQTSLLNLLISPFGQTVCPFTNTKHIVKSSTAIIRYLRQLLLYKTLGHNSKLDSIEQNFVNSGDMHNFIA